SNLAAGLACGVLAVSACALPDGWTDNFEQAKTSAADSGKDLLLDFTGSDWCGWCIKLREEVFDQPSFKETAPENFVLVELDYPNAVPQSDEVKAQNARLQEVYDIAGYPTILLTDATGLPYAKTGYQPGGSDSYLEHLEELRGRKAARDEAMLAADEAEGVDKARALDAALNAVGLELAVEYYGDVIEQIVELDPEGAAGLKDKYEQMMNAGRIDEQMQDAFALLSQQEFQAGLAKLNQVMADNELDDQQKQIIMAIKGQVHAEMGDLDKAVEMLNAAIAVMPDSEVAPQIKELAGQLQAAPDE
ncbi:MAG: thioredoxin family protein, partial [Planctomycetota bacterium]